jgi:hypothetical protein
VQDVGGGAEEGCRVGGLAESKVAFEQRGSSVSVSGEEPAGEPLACSGPGAVVVEEKVGCGLQNGCCHGELLEAVRCVGEIVEGIGQRVPAGLDRLEAERSRPFGQERLRPGLQPRRLSLLVDDDDALGVHVLHGPPARGGVRGEEFREPHAGVDEELHR